MCILQSPPACKVFSAGEIVLAAGGVCVTLDGQTYEGGVTTFGRVCVSVCMQVAETAAGEANTRR